MKSTGIIRKVDELGRVVLPMELRKTMEIDVKDPMEIFVEDDRIILQKFKSDNACMITGEVSEENLSLAGGKIVLSQEGAQMLIQELENYIQKS